MARTFIILAAIAVVAFGGALLLRPALKLPVNYEDGYCLVFRIVSADSAMSAPDLEKVIAILKERADPDGRRKLQLRPLAGNRIEVRMPASSPQAAAARDAYEQALDRLWDNCFRIEHVQFIADTPPNERKREIQQITFSPSQRERLLAAVAACDDVNAQCTAIEVQLAALQQQRQAVIASNDGAAQLKQIDEQIDELRLRKLNARNAYDTALTALERHNVDVEKVTYLLARYYRSGQDAQDMDPQEVRSRERTLNDRLAEMTSRYDEQANALIADVVAAYKAWADIREPWEDPDDLIRLICRPGKLEFRMAPRQHDGDLGLTAAEMEQYLRRIETDGPEAGRQRNDKFAWFRILDEDAFRDSGFILAAYAGGRYILLSDSPDDILLCGDWKLEGAQRSAQDGRPMVQFTFDDHGAERFARLTGSHRGKSMAILLDDEVYSAPVIRSQIRKSGVIDGRFTVREVDDIVKTLQAGSLPVELRLDSISRIQPSQAMSGLETADEK